MKKLLIFILSIGIILSCVACGGETELAKQQKHEALKIAMSVELPQLFSEYTGKALAPGEIEVNILRYNTKTGEPYFEITCEYSYQDGWKFDPFGTRHTSQTLRLVYIETDSIGYDYWLFTYTGISLSYLKTHELRWS